MLRSRSTRRRIHVLVCYAAALSIVSFAMFPVLWALLTSLKPESDIVTATIQYIPERVTFENYVAIWTRSNFPTLIANSAVVTLTTVVICVVIGTLASYAVARYRFRGRRELMLFYLVVRMFPAVMIIVPLFILMRSVGLLDSRLGLALAYTTFLLPVFIWMMKGFFDAVPSELEDAARIDGASRIGAMLRIVLPLVMGGLVATAVFVAIGAWNEFLFALMLTTSTGSRTWPVGLQLMVGEFQLPWGALSAGGIISIVPVVVLFAIVQRAMVRGLTAGAVKG
ncbi:multiple sugar transport system permease protein [Inquilinus ginsengisoli]|uniref:Multiple sugar transport system permease protein n=1 Tax=Inquilinus ginsengisoli TaxID=363840 RepID=A0ABU1K3F5_9PROT|nr:carbohydrate ABC transporter permease [Inquilinus ginsengisoli]MDR6294345.1 multiple sugar transport system permease protein [Inquilinus ginsengisoli]